MLVYRVPYYPDIDTEIFMSDKITQSDNFAIGKRILLWEFCLEFVSCFSEMLKLHEARINGLVIPIECLEIHT